MSEPRAVFKSHTSNHWRRHLAVLGFFLGATIGLTWPLAKNLGGAIPGDAFDGWQNYWNLWWVRVALLDQHTHPYFTNALYHPTGVSLWFQTINIFNGLSSLPVQLAGNLFWAYNAVVLFSFVFAGYGATLLGLYGLRRAGATEGWSLWAGAVLAGVVFTFSPFHFAHLLGHMQVFSLTFIPFFVLYLLRSLDPSATTLQLRNAVIAALFLTLAALCDWYFGLYLGLFSVLYALWLLARRRLRWPHAGALAITFGLTLLVTAPLLAPMVIESVRYDFMKPPPGQIIELSADILSFILPSGQHPLWGRWAAQLRAGLPASPSENTLYVGFVVLALSLLGLLRRRLRLGFWALAAIVFAVFSLGPLLHVGGEIVRLPGGRPLPMPYTLLLKLPFIEIARTVARYDLLVTLSLGMLAGGGLYTLLARFPRKWLALAILALVLFEYAPAPYPVSPSDAPAWYQTLAQDPNPGAVLNLPMNWDRPGYLLYQTVHAKPLTAGYISRTDPRTYPSRIPVLSDFRHNGPDINAVDVAAYAPTIFDFADVRWVVADRYKMPPGPTRAFNEALLLQIFAGRQPIFEDDRLTVYETWPPTTPLPFIEIGPEWGPRQPGPQRAVGNQADLIVHSPDGSPLLLEITPAAGASAAFWLEDANDQIVGRSEGEAASWLLDLAAGPNTFTLHTDHPALAIHRLALQSPSPN